MTFMLGARNAAALHRIRTTANPQRAVDSGATNCQRSGVCCWQRPCDLFPGDAERMAALLKISPTEVFREYLIVDDLGDGSGLRLLPRREQQTGGRYLTVAETYDIDTPCVFLDVANGNACRVQAAKPHGGARFHCTMAPAEIAALPPPRWTEEQLVAIGWDGERDGDW